MKKTPSTHGSDGRDKAGRFAKGNHLGKGNPLAGRAAKIRAALLEKLTPEAAGEVADKIIELAKAGNLAAAQTIFDRTIGKPSQGDLTERVERLEQLLEENQ